MVVTTGGMIKGPLAFTLLQMLAVEGHHDMKTVVRMVNMAILFCHVGFTLPHYILTKFIVKTIKTSKIGYGLEQKEKHKLNIETDGLTIHVDPKHPKVITYIDKFFLKPLMIRDWYKRGNELKSIRNDI